MSTTPLKERVSFRQLLIADGHQVKKVGKSYKLSCPFHLDNNPSFVISDDDTKGKCFGCNWTGDIINYLRETRTLKYDQALEELIKLPAKEESPRITTQRTLERSAPTITHEQRMIMVEACKLLADSNELCSEIAKPRKWKPKTIHALAKEGSLGSHNGNLAFAYPQCLKLRKWPEKKIWIEFGAPCLWRRKAITDDTKRIYLCEGETDAITLIDKGLNKPGEAVVVALPSATTISDALVTILEGKEVILCMDNDNPGKEAEKKLIALLHPVCPKLNKIDLEQL